MIKPVYILGGDQTDFERNWTKEGKSFIGMLREVVEDSLEYVRIDYNEISELNKSRRIGIFIGNFAGELYLNQGHLGAFLTQINPAFIGIPAGRYEAACASGSVAIDSARAKIAAGDYDVALVIGIEMMKTVKAVVGAAYLGTAAYYKEEAAHIEFPFPKLFGKLADSLLEKYNLNETRFLDALAEISRINYGNAKRNHKAQTRYWFMTKEHSNSRYVPFNSAVGGKLCIADCSQITDGAAIVVLASSKYTESYCSHVGKKIADIPFIKGYGYRVAPVTYADKIAIGMSAAHILPWTKEAIDDAYSMAGIRIDDIRVIETHDCFTSSEYAAISAFGLSAPGKEYEAIESGLIDFNGSHPINPSGGLIGVGHPVGASGVRMLLDLYKQVSGTAGEYQVAADVRNAVMLNIGGSATTNIVFVVGR